MRRSRFGLLLFVAVTCSSIADAAESLNNSHRARRLLEIARDYLPADWRYPTLETPMTPKLKMEFERLLPVRMQQQPNGYTCGSASFGILLSHFGKHYSQSFLDRLTDMSTDGIDPWKLVRAGQRAGFNVEEHYNSTVEDVLKDLSNGQPVLIDYQASYEPSDDPNDEWGHYSVIIAADATDFLIADPSQTNPAQIRRIPLRELPSVWWDTLISNGQRFDRWRMTMTPKARR